jgi:hypothetical protein
MADMERRYKTVQQKVTGHEMQVKGLMRQIEWLKASHCRARELQTLKLEEIRQLESRVAELKILEKNVEGIYAWCESFQEDVQSRWPNRHKSRYKRVKILLVRWASDDLDVYPEMAELAAAFRNFYGYDLKYY